MKYLTLLALLPLFAAPAFADGGSIGGGTNIVIQENELTDFVNFNSSFGKQSKTKPSLINPQTARFPGEQTPFFTEIKPLIERMDNLYPGMGTIMGKAYANKWLVADATFAGRSSDEVKVVSQTEYGIYVSLNWLKTAPRDQIMKAFVHEGVRTFARELVTFYAKGKKGPKYSALEDAVTEELTPAVYGEFPSNMTEGHLKKAGEMIADKLFWIGSDIDFPSRADIYPLFTAVNARSLIMEICSADLDESRNLFKAREAYLKKTPGAKKPLEKLSTMYRQQLFEHSQIFDPSVISFLRLVRNTFEDTLDSRVVSEICREKKYERFLKEFEADGGKFTDKVTGKNERPLEELEEVPTSQKPAE